MDLRRNIANRTSNTSGSTGSSNNSIMSRGQFVSNYRIGENQDRIRDIRAQVEQSSKQNEIVEESFLDTEPITEPGPDLVPEPLIEPSLTDSSQSKEPNTLMEKRLENFEETKEEEKHDELVYDLNNEEFRELLKKLPGKIGLFSLNGHVPMDIMKMWLKVYNLL